MLTEDIFTRAPFIHRKR